MSRGLFAYKSARFVAAAGAALGLMASAFPGAAEVYARMTGATPITANIQPVLNTKSGAHSIGSIAAWRGYTTTAAQTTSQSTSISRALATTSATIPYWTSTVKSPIDGATYTTSMVGTSPFAATPSNTNIPFVPVVLKVRFLVGSSYVTLDPTQPSCTDTVPVVSRFLNSPLFQKVSFTSNGVDVTSSVGGAQLTSAFQRANYWNNVKGTQYGVTLTPAINGYYTATLTVTGAKIYRISCGGTKTAYLAAIDINTFDNVVESLVRQVSNPTQLPLVLTYNVVQTESGQCCILGYHNAVALSTGVQTYSVGAYVDSGVFSKVDDISTWSHEIAEWLDDPFVQTPGVAGGDNDDLTPAWGNVGQVVGCQNNLEVGDPLSGTEYAITGAANFKYHFQDLAFQDWFYHSPSKGTGGRYSFMGTFSSAQAKVCV